jgi:hypothetical protein
MLASAGVVIEGEVQTLDFRDPWFLAAVQLFWDRQIFDGVLREGSALSAYRASFFDQEIHKLLACSEQQADAFIAVSFREYGRIRMKRSVEQIQNLRKGGLIAA